MSRRRLPLVAVLALLATPAPAAAQAWMRWDVAPRPVAMGGAAAALDDAASAAWYHPAGIASFLNTRVAAGGAVSTRSGDLEAAGRGEFDREAQTLVDPYLFVVHPIARNLNAGLAVVSPWELATSWEDPEEFVGRFQAFRARLRSVDVSPVLAWRAGAALSVAAGVHVAWAKLELDRFEQDPDLSALGGLGPIALARSEIAMDGTGVGWVLGAHWRPAPALAVGGHVRSGVNLGLSGPVDFTGTAPASLRSLALPGEETTIGERLDATYVDQNARLGFELPATAAAGVAWDPVEPVRLVATAQWANWSAADTLTLAFADTTLGDRTPLAYDDAWSLRFGVEVRHSPELSVRLGYAHEASPAPPGGVTPLVPDADRNALSAGLGLTWAGLMVDVGYRIAFLEDRSGVAFPGGAGPEGIYGGAEHRLAVGVSREM